MSKIVKKEKINAPTHTNKNAKLKETLMIVPPSKNPTNRAKQLNTYEDWNADNIVCSKPTLNANKQLSTKITYKYKTASGKPKESMLILDAPLGENSLFRSNQGVTFKKAFDPKAKEGAEVKYTDKLQCYSTITNKDDPDTIAYMNIWKDIYIAVVEAITDSQLDAQGGIKDFNLKDDWKDNVTFTDYVSDFNFPLFFPPIEKQLKTTTKKGDVILSTVNVPNAEANPLIGADVYDKGRSITKFVTPSTRLIELNDLMKRPFVHIPCYCISSAGWYSRGVKIRTTLQSSIVIELLSESAVHQIDALEEIRMNNVGSNNDIDAQLDEAIAQAEEASSKADKKTAAAGAGADNKKSTSSDDEAAGEED